MEDEVRQTIAAYDQIAPVYADFWSDRRVVERPLTLFGSLLPPGAVVLDAGCGPGFDGALLRERGLNVIGLDRSHAMLEIARDRYPGTYVQGDLTNLPIGDGTLSAIWASATLLHLPRKHFVPALKEFDRVLMADGLLYLSLKEGDGEQWRSDACGREAPRFFTYWQQDDLDVALQQVRFSTVAGWREPGRTADWLIRVVSKRGDAS